MTQPKTNKKALLTSALSLLLCCTMLIGTTWAWFTDSVTSSGNKIQSGTLQIDLLVKGGNTGKTEYTSVKDGELANKPIFNYELWEPGYTLVTYAKVINKGNLALKYTLNFTSESNIAAAELAEVIDVYYAPSEVSGIDTRAGFNAAVENGDIKKLDTLRNVFAGGEALAVNDHLEPNGKDNFEDYATIVLKMQETAGNEYQDKTIPAFDIQLLATQWTYESDSFDDQYDEFANGLPDHPEWADLSANVTKAAVAGKETVLTNPDGSIRATVPADGAVGDVNITVKPADVDGNVVIADNKKAVAYDIKVTGQNDGTVVQVDLYVGKNLTGLSVYHDGTAMTSAESGADNTFRYDIDSGVLTIYTGTFSNFTIVYNNPNGTTPIEDIPQVEGTYQVNTVADLKGIKDYINGNNTSDMVIALHSDIDLSNQEWEGIAVNGYVGDGVITVDGNGHKITGLSAPLFTETWAGKSGLVIRNLTIADSAIQKDLNDSTSTVGVGAFIGWPQASEVITLENCHLLNSSVKGGHWAGGLIGIAAGYSGNDGPVFETVTIRNCSVKDSTIESKGSVGAVIGHATSSAWTKVIVDNCVVSGNTVTSTGSSTNKAGSITGTVGVAGTATTVNGRTETGGTYVTNTTIENNTVTSGNVSNSKIFGRVASTGGKIYLDEVLIAENNGNGDIIH